MRVNKSMTKQYEDKPRSLKDASMREVRIGELEEPHNVQLTEFVVKLRDDTRQDKNIPYFDPCDGGENAEILFLLEAPGPKAVYSGFISRNNDDATARNFFEINNAVGISRERTIIWNIVPWYIGDGVKIRHPTVGELEVGFDHLSKLLTILKKIRVVVLVGKNAQNAAVTKLSELNPKLNLLNTDHPSSTNVNCNLAKLYNQKTEESINKKADKIINRTSIDKFLKELSKKNNNTEKGMKVLLEQWLDISIAINESKNIIPS